MLEDEDAAANADPSLNEVNEYGKEIERIIRERSIGGVAQLHTLLNAYLDVETQTIKDLENGIHTDLKTSQKRYSEAFTDIKVGSKPVNQKLAGGRPRIEKAVPQAKSPAGQQAGKADTGTKSIVKGTARVDPTKPGPARNQEPATNK